MMPNRRRQPRVNRRRFLQTASLSAAAGWMAGASDFSAGADAMQSKVRFAHVDDRRQFAAAKELLEADNPGIRLSLVEVDGQTALRSEHGGMRVFWIYRGAGEVFLTKGYRTQEGDGRPLPEVYRPEPLPPAFADALKLLEEKAAAVSDGAKVPVAAILKRLRGNAFCGNYAGDLWTLLHAKRPWAADPAVEETLQNLFHRYRDVGFSVKQEASFEPLSPGDQVIAAGDETVRVRGRFSCMCMENIARKTSHESTARRLDFLMDTAGGCNPDFDPFRRLPLTWYPNYPGESGDGLNWVNSHVVNIPKETSPTHFHPPRAVGGELPQREMYLVLDPAGRKLNTWGRKASLILFPDLRDLRKYEQRELTPGTFVYIPPGTGHRGLDVFVNVLTFPGFRPHNEYYIDRDVRDLGGGKSPCNENLLKAKNYRRIEDFL